MNQGPPNAPPPQSPHEEWVCLECRWTNNGMRVRCRNCDTPRTAKSGLLRVICLSCGVTGTVVELQDARTARGAVKICTTCGDEYKVNKDTGRLERVHTARVFIP